MSIRVTIACATAVLCAVLPAAAQTASQGAAQTAAETAASAQTPPVKRESVSRLITGFNIVLVVGEAKPSGSASADELPAGARKALTDMREFLPVQALPGARRAVDVVLSAHLTDGDLGATAGSCRRSLAEWRGQPGQPRLFVPDHGWPAIDNLPVQFVLAVDEGSRGHAAQGGDVDGRELRAAGAGPPGRDRNAAGADQRDANKRVEAGTASPLELRPMQDRMASMQRRLADRQSRQRAAHASPTAGRSSTAASPWRPARPWSSAPRSSEATRR